MVIGNFVVGGGLSGMAEELAGNSIRVSDVLFENVLWVFASTLGIGLFLRRSPEQALTRLGLRLPTPQDFNWGIGIGTLLFGCVIIVSLVWSAVVSPEVLQEQTAASSQLAQSFSSLPVALAVSLIVAFGEEIFFRGALQPVFGIVPTSLIFAALHTQYILTPATVVIIITALGMGWLRKRQSTTAAIIGHFVYNFIQLAITVLLSTSLSGV
jgi:membrane protease YdiL (CAAX protease family)